jgi:hypothetical protein
VSVRRAALPSAECTTGEYNIVYSSILIIWHTVLLYNKLGYGCPSIHSVSAVPTFSEGNRCHSYRYVAYTNLHTQTHIKYANSACAILRGDCTLPLPPSENVTGCDSQRLADNYYSNFWVQTDFRRSPCFVCTSYIIIL